MQKAIRLVTRFLAKCQKDKINAYSAQIAFFIILSIFYSFLLTPFCVNDIIDSLHPRNRGHADN